jgi:hypothetical protein
MTDDSFWSDENDVYSEHYENTAPTVTPEVQEKIDAQQAYCDKLELPQFAPTDGICWCCSGQIYKAITLEKASTQHITGCPLCCRTYCD